jgi:hypothetical protein
MQLNTIENLLEWLEPRTSLTANVGGDVENRNAHSLPMGKQNGTATLEAS